MITMEDFRRGEGYADLRAALHDFLRSDAGLFALRILRDNGRPADVPPTLDSLASARSLSQFHGYHKALDDLEKLATPLVVGPEIESTFESQETDHEPRQSG
jgi:hypothetical protein